MEVLNKDLLKKILKAQRNEICDFFVYKKLSSVLKNKKNSEILENISNQELIHYEFLKSLTKKELKPNKLKVFIYTFIAKVFGINFSLKLMENTEDLTQDTYKKIREISPKIDEILKDENEHENKLISLIDEERLKYVSSVVLGLNDALVELSGALIGFTLALQKTRLVGIVGLITGIAASMSMSASEYLSTKHEDTDKNPFKASIYTGFAYIGAVIILVLPYFLFKNIYLCLGLVVLNMILLIFIFTFYTSISKSLCFKKRFLEMLSISLSVAIINFIIGLIIRNVFKIDI